jgi:hypothetical protein
VPLNYVTPSAKKTISLAEFGEIADQQLARGNPGPHSCLGRTKSGKNYQKPSGDNEAPEAPEAERLNKSQTRQSRN